MSIKRSEFEKGNFKKRKHLDKNRHPVTEFLKGHKSRAYTIKEISKSTKMKEETVRSWIRGLKKQGHVEHKTPYFIWKK